MRTASGEVPSAPGAYNRCTKLLFQQALSGRREEIEVVGTYLSTVSFISKILHGFFLDF